MRNELERNYSAGLVVETLTACFTVVIGLSFLTLMVMVLLSLIILLSVMELHSFLSASYHKGMRHLFRWGGYIVHY